MAGAPAWATEATPEWAKGTTTSAVPAWAAGATPEKPSTTTPSTPDTPPSSGGMLATTASALDIPLGIPSMLLQTGAEVGSVAVGTLAAPFTHETPAHILKSAREAGQTAGSWLANPLEKAMKGAGVGGYDKTAPAWAMQKVSGLAEKGATALEKTTGVPKDAYMILLDELMSAGGVRAPDWIKERVSPKEVVSAEDRLKAAQPTGTKPPPDLTDAQIADVEKRMETRPLGEPSDVIHKGRVEEMRKRSANLAEGEPIAHPSEGDLTIMDAMLRSGDYTPTPEVAQEVHATLSHPDTSYSGGSDPMYDHIVDVVSKEKRASIPLVLRNLKSKWPDANWQTAERITKQMEAEGIIGRQGINGRHDFIGKPVVEQVNAARDIAHQQVEDAVKEDIAKQKPAKVRVSKPKEPPGLLHTIKKMGGINGGSIRDITGETRAGKGVSGIPPGLFHENGLGIDDLATQLKDMGYDINTNEVDGGVQQLKDMIRAEMNGEKILPQEAGYEQFLRDYHGEGGKIHPALLAKIAAAGGGAAAGAYLDPQHPLVGALEAAGLGFAVTNIGARMYDMGAGATIKVAIDAIKPSYDPIRKAAADAMNAKDANIEASMRQVLSISKAVSKAIPKERLERIGILMSSGKLDSLTPTERYYIGRVQAELAKLGSSGQEAGALPNLMKEYGLPLIWDMKDAKTKTFFDELFSTGEGEKMSASSFTPFSLKRSVPDYLSGIVGGLKPLTTNPAELLSIYARSVIKATENAKALSYLKALKTADGYAVEPVGKAMPKDYITDHNIRGLEGFGIHPEMVASLKLGFDGYQPGMIGRGMLAAAFTAKRLIVSYSPFHAVSEALAYTGAGGNPIGLAAGAVARGIEKLSGNRISIPFRSAVDKAFDDYFKGGAGDYLDFLLRNGLKKGAAIEDTIGRAQFDKMTHWLDTAIGMDKLAPFTRLDDAMHAFTFGYIQAGVKMETAMRLFEKELIDPRNAGKDVNEIAADVSSFANGMAGGLNWPRIVEGMRSKFGRALAGDLFSKKGLTKLQVAMLAPDWFYSTIRAWTQAVPGLSESARVGRLQRAYLARSMVLTLIASDAANVHYSGHHLWENDFRTANEKKKGEYPNLLQRIHYMTEVDMGDGTRVNPNKHLYEFVHMMTDFPSFVMGKANPIISEPVAGLMNKQWLSPHWTPPITPGGTATQQAGDYLKWLVKQNMPISLQQINSGANYGIVGFPRSGITSDKREQLREKARDLKQERELQ